MAWMEKDVGNGKERDPVGDNGSMKEEQPASGTNNPSDCISPGQKKFEGKDALSYANILRSRNKFVDALALYESILEKDCGNVDAHIGKGICLQMQNMGRLAFESFAEAIKLEPQNVCALTHCGIVYKDEGQLIEAAESYQKALRVDPSYKPAAEYLAIVLTDLGTSLKLAGNAQEGIQKYYEAIKIDPHYAPAYYNLGVVYSEMMQYDMALGCYEKAALERPMYAEAYCNMGVIYKNRGDLESAIACYERCLVVSPNFEIAKNNMAIALTDLGTKVKLEGDIDQGVEYYKKALYYNWHYADAMYNLGVAYGEMLKFDMAIVFYELAFHFNPHCAEACNNLGVIYKDRDNLDKAVECYQLALSIKPNFSQSLNNLGVVYTVQGKMDAAASMIEKAIVANPTYAEAYNNLGVLYRDAGNITLAIESYEQCLKIDPDSRNAGQNRLLAMNYIHEGTDDKLFEAHRFKSRDSTSPQKVGAMLCTHYLSQSLLLARALCMFDLSDVQFEARGEISLWLWDLILSIVGVLSHWELEEALVWVYFHSNIPEYNKVECWGPLKNAAAPSKVSSCGSYKDKGDETPSISSWNTPSLPSSLPPATHSPAKYPTPFLVSPNPLSPSTRLSSFSSRKSCRGVVAMAGSGKFFVGGNWKCNGTKESISKLVSDLNSAKLEPDVDVVVAPPFVYVDLVKNSLTDRIEISAQTSWIGKGGAFTGEIRVEQLQDIGCKWVILGHSERRHVIGEDDQDWGRRFMRLYPQYTSWENPKDPERPLVIGYVSPDYFTHSVSYFIEAPLVYHDYANHKVVVYSAVVKADAKTNRFRDKVLKNGGIWRDIYGIDEKKVASMVREDKVDILIELTGHTANNKLGMMACRPAPVQVTWIGYPNTTGLPTIDYRITDALADSPDTRHKWVYVEELVRLPECFLCYTPSPEAGPVSPTPALSNGFITFGSFNNLAKITTKVLQVWARILCAVPNSRLVVKCKPFCSDSVRQRFLSTLEQLGLESQRVDLLPLILLNHDHMQSYALMDISLDTFPYAGTTTTCESLYMGVPCVTMGGSVHAHNVGVSLLSTVGLGHLVAKNEDEYVQLALKLASDVTALSNMRTGLRDLMSKSPLCDGSKFTLGLESTYRNMWKGFCKGDVPSLRRMEILQQQQIHQVSSEEPTVKISEPTKTATNSREGHLGSVKKNGFNLETHSILNLSTSEENGVVLLNQPNSGNLS
ncbi:unnamed protein product [Camellia sinensis]